MILSFKGKVALLCLIASISVVSINVFFIKPHDNAIKNFTKISEAMSKNLNQLRTTPGIITTGLAADPNKKLFKIGINRDTTKITPEQLDKIIELYLVNTSSFTTEQDWRSLFKPYDIIIENIADGKLIGEKPLDSTEINWISQLQ
jgi:hypothetical protein